MPEFAGPIKFPVPADRYNTAYGEPQWWKELAETAAAAISAKANAGHTHSALSNGTFSADLSSAGAFALRSGSTNMVQWNASNGNLVAGNVPWARITGAPTAGNWVSGATTDALNTLTAPGLRYSPSFAAAANRPPGAGGGSVWTYPIATSYVGQMWIDEAGWVARRAQTTVGGWTTWNGGSDFGSAGASAGHAAHLSQWLSESPPVHTGGKGAVAFSFDHGLTKFKSAGLPAAMSSRGFGYALALNSATLSSAENSGASTADILSWQGAEIWNHGRTHQAAADDAEVHTEIISGKAELETRFGREIFGYIPAGVGPTGLNGFDGGTTPEQWGGTLAGRLIMQHHAVTTGYMGTGGIRQLTGTVQQGIVRMTVDAMTVTRIKQQIDLAVSSRVGVMFMLHPNLLDQSGYLTTAQFVEVLTYAKARKDAGELAVLSPGELVRADAGDSTALTYDSGLRNVSQYLNTGWSGSLYAKRVAGRVTFQFVDVKRTEAGGSTAVVSVPGFQPLGVDQPAVGYLGDDATPAVTYRARVTQYGVSLAGIPVGTGLSGDVHFNTTRGIPTNPPGSAA